MDAGLVKMAGDVEPATRSQPDIHARLARNSTDRNRLLVTNKLILEEDGLYNPSHVNDRLLSGLKGR